MKFRVIESGSYSCTYIVEAKDKESALDIVRSTDAPEPIEFRRVRKVTDEYEIEEIKEG